MTIRTATDWITRNWKITDILDTDAAKAAMSNCISYLSDHVLQILLGSFPRFYGKHPGSVVSSVTAISSAERWHLTVTQSSRTKSPCTDFFQNKFQFRDQFLQTISGEFSFQSSIDLIIIIIIIIIRPPRLDLRSRPKALCFTVGQYLFLSVSELPLNFISRTRNFYIISDWKTIQTVLLLVPLIPPKINDVIKSAKRDTLENFFWKLTLSSHGHVVLLLPYTTQLFESIAFFPLRGKLIAPKKNLLLLISRKFLISETFFHHRILFDWGHKRPWPDGARDSPFGGGVKNKFSKRVIRSRGRASHSSGDCRKQNQGINYQLPGLICSPTL